MALDNFIPKNNMAECNTCRKFRKETISCEKYMEWIPRQKPVGYCEDYEPDEQKVKEQEAWEKQVKKMVAEMVARAEERKRQQKAQSQAPQR